MNRKLILILSLVLCAFFVLTACGGDTVTDNSEQPPSDTSKENEIKESQERIVRVTAAFPINCDPHTGASGGDQIYMFNVYDALVFSEADGTLVPHLAEKWDISDDGLTYHFYLRKGVKFHDGTELKANDVVFSYNRLVNLGEGFAYLYVDYVDSFEVVDDYTVRVNMKKTFGPFITSLVRFPIACEAIVRKNTQSGDYGEFGDYGKAYLLDHDAGSGPYRLVEYAAQSYAYCDKFDDYFLGWTGNNPEKFHIISTADAATLRTMFSNKELEITDEWQSNETLTALAKMDGVTVAHMKTGQVLTVEFNTALAPTDDVHFRKALAHLVDYDTILDQIFPGTNQAYGPVSQSYKGSSKDLYQYNYDIDKAKEELALSRYADNFGEYEITLQYSEDVADQGKVALLLQQSLAEVGITLKVNAVPWATQVASVGAIETTPNVSIYLPSGDFNEAGSVLQTSYHSSSTGSIHTYMWVQDDEIDNMIMDALSTVDDEQRMKKYKELQSFLIDYCPAAYINDQPEKRAYQSGYLYWPEGELAAQGGNNAPLYGRAVYARTIEFLD